LTKSAGMLYNRNSITCAMKCCKICKTEKPLSEYSLVSKAGSITKGKYVRRKDTYCTLCKKCKSEQNLRKQRNRTKEQKQRVGDLHKWRQLMRLYGLTKERYNAMLVEQNNMCKICGGALEPACVDHDHTTGKVRHLLCNPCNMSLGLVKEDTKILNNMISYINDNIS